ncbi:MAG: DUF2264 domain-containing protein [Actinomycetota bacterium]|nr:DUF2264 domain-containing protein [Actinomycetota bacterium]MEC9395091.1 DUF2264 domain-containing protein [Actinomycetota bacterium]MEC9466957.1 DUF2264 domain-containing protein [Actinomycetota bacterium]MEE2959061.1 DUF2264 domain-containing protein [Actinomycetota bacterium]
MNSNDPRANPLAGNPFATKGDAQRAARDLIEPVVRHLSPGGARARLGSGAALFEQRVAELEGWARPLYGIVPLTVGGGHFAHWDRWRDGLVAGTNPDDDEYWGPCSGDNDQRMVEMAAVGFALAFTPDHLWEPLDDPARQRVLAWLDGIDDFEPAPNNWQFFRLLVHMGRERVGAPGASEAALRSIERIEEYHVSGGWSRDGALGNVDWYLPFAFHTYGLMLHASGLGDREAADRYLERARLFGPEFVHWFGPDGAGIAYGRSMTYRFAQSSLWGAYAMADIEAIPWAEVRGHWRRHLRWWEGRPVSDRDGVLSIGYGYDNRRLAEAYNSAGSPYWAMKAFVGLAAPDDHPFWTGVEAPPKPLGSPVAQPIADRIVDRDDVHAVALSAGRTTSLRFIEQTEAKYEKFAYSSRYGFTGEVEFGWGASETDSTLALTDGDDRRSRSRVEDVEIVGRNGTADATVGLMLWSRWRPWPDVVVDTVLTGGANHHHRVHLIRTGRAVAAVETGFAIGVDSLRLSGGESEVRTTTDDGAALLETVHDVTGLVDRPADLARTRKASIRPLPPNASMVEPASAIPVLSCSLEPGEHFLACTVWAAPTEAGPEAANLPSPPDEAFALLERLCNRVTEPVKGADVESLISLRFRGTD